MPIDERVRCLTSMAASDEQPPVAFHARGVLRCLAVCAVVDRGLLAQRWSGVKPEARWFVLHALANAVVARSGVRDVLAVLRRPDAAMTMTMQSWTPSHLAFAVHLWHTLAYNKLRAEDLWHHALFVGTFGYVNFSMRWGPVVNLLLFFMTGLPGGLDYAMLAAVKQGLLPAMREKAINAKINTYLRAPGLVFTAALLYTCARTGRSRVHPLAAGLCAALCYGNGVFYGWQVNDDFSRRVAAVAAAGAAGGTAVATSQ